MASISGCSPQGQAHSRLSRYNSRPPALAKSTVNDRVESPSRDRNANFQDVEISNSVPETTSTTSRFFRSDHSVYTVQSDYDASIANVQQEKLISFSATSSGRDFLVG